MGRPDDLDWDDVRYFLRAVQAGTLAGAARALGVEHTTIGRRLSSLERALGAPLVFRGPEGLRLTPLGEKLAPLARDVERAVAAIRDAAASDRPRVRLAVPTGFTKLFTERIADLRTLRPDIALELVSGAGRVRLEKGEADLAIRGGPVGGDELVARKLCDSGWALYAAESYLARHGASVEPDDLQGHEIIGFDPSLAAVPPARWLQARSAGVTVVLRSREASEMMAAAVAGAGLAALPCMMADEEPMLRRLTPVIATHRLSLVYRRESRVSEDIRAVSRFVIAVINENAERIRGAPA